MSVLTETVMPHILIIDDLRANRLSLKIMLGARYQITQAASSDEGMQRFQEGIYDLILVDYQMPQADGLSFLARLRQIDSDVAVAMVSAHASLESAIQAMHLEAFDYLQKPYTEEKLNEVVSRGVQLTQTRREAARMARIGLTADEFIHDLSNPLSVVACMAPFLKDEELAGKSREAVEAGVERCQNLMKIWHDQTRSTGYFSNWYSPNLLLSSLEKQIANTLKGVKCVLHQFPTTSEVQVDKSQFMRVIDNLVNNAVYAVLHSEGGLAGGIQIRADIHNGRCIFQVQDTGNGMSEETLTRITTPYFTTKGKEGTGLGLAICKRIVTDMQGDLTFESIPGVGTTVKVSFPAREIKSVH